MPSRINSTTTSPGGLISTGDSDNSLLIQTGDTTAITISSTQQVTLTNPLPVGSGGTGANSNAAAPFAVKGANSDITSLSGLTTALSVAQGGTGANTATAAFNALNPMTTTGDMLYEASPTTAARLAIGSTGQVLTVAGGIPTWATPASGSDVVIVSSSSMFTSSGTYTVPTLGENEQLYALMIGGGGSGGASTNGVSQGYTASTGGGGRIGMALLNKAQLAATITYTIGAGGTAVTTSGGGEARGGNMGGSTTVTSNSNLLALIYGGDQGNADYGDGSNRTLIGTSIIGPQSIYVDSYNPNFIVLNAPYQLQCGGRSATSESTTYTVPRFFGGGSGAINNGSSQRAQNVTGASATTFTGAGGAGSASGNGSAGSVPGGGGGGSSRNTTATSGAGAAGGIKFYVVRGIYDAQSVFNKVFTL
jgi:hypothetical protein